MQDSRWALTRADQRSRIPSLDLLVTLLLRQPRIRLAFWAASTHCCINQHHQVLLRAALNPFSNKPLFVLGVALTHVQGLHTLGLGELHGVLTEPLLRLAWVPLDGPSLRHVNRTTQLGVINTCFTKNMTAMLEADECRFVWQVVVGSRKASLAPSRVVQQNSRLLPRQSIPNSTATYLKNNKS